MINKDNVLSLITEHYLHSAGFNGISSSRLLRITGLNEDELKPILTAFIAEGLISLNFGDIHPTPHIKAWPEESEKVQIEKLLTYNFTGLCVYPLPKHLADVVDVSNYNGRPFTLMLALGEPQLAHKSFDPSVLEIYRNDPRYDYWNNDISGRVCVTNEYYAASAMPHSDKVVLKFGFAHDSDLNRVIAAFLCNLSNLSPEHQRIWQAKLLLGVNTLHPDYYKSTIGDWDLGISVFEAFLGELHRINTVCRLMNRPALFRREFQGEDKPPTFGFLIRPTSEDFNAFIHLLDKMLSDNIAEAFFRQDISLTKIEEKNNIKHTVHKRTLALLEEWLTCYSKLDDSISVKELMSPLHSVRNKRDKSAHSVNKNVFDRKYLKEQRDHMRDVYDAIRRLRIILAAYAETNDCKVPEMPESRHIWFH